MNIDNNIIPSVLKVVASENLDISQDLVSPESTKTIDELLNEKTDQEKNG